MDNCLFLRKLSTFIHKIESCEHKYFLNFLLSSVGYALPIKCVNIRLLFRGGQIYKSLAVTFGEGGSASGCEPRRKGTINYYFLLLCVFIPYRQNLAYALFCHFPRRRKRCRRFRDGFRFNEEFSPKEEARAVRRLCRLLR